MNGDKIILILADSLRLDFATKHLKGIFPEESWSSFDAIETFTAPVLASVFTGQHPDVTGMKGQALYNAFIRGLPKEACKDTLFHHFDSWVTISRLIGNGPKWLPPSRRDNFKFLPPIDWHAESNNDDDVLEYVGRKWSIATPKEDWKDLIFYHSWLTHGPWGIDCYGPKELPCIVNCDRLMMRQTIEQNHDWYMRGIEDFTSRLRGLMNICDNKETIIVFADHGESLGEEESPGHFAGSKSEFLRKVPIWVNRSNIDLEGINHLKIKDLCVRLYKEYELENEEYQRYKEMLSMP